MGQEELWIRPVKVCWAVVNTQVHQESVALENLSRQHFSAYCPFVRRRVSHARRKLEVLKPLFPGYLFVRIGPDQPYLRPIHSTRGVRSLVHFGDQLALLKDQFIQELRSRQIDGAIVPPPCQYKVDQRVRLEQGPMSEVVGTIVEMDERGRVIALMNLFNRPVRVKLTTAVLAPA